MRYLLNAKIHRARVTSKDINYNGSITIDEEILNLVGILPWEKVQVVDVDNGARLETYVIPGEQGQRDIQLNGAAAHLVEVGDRVIIMSYALLNDAEIINHHPIIVILNEKNQIEDISITDKIEGKEVTIH